MRIKIKIKPGRDVDDTAAVRAAFGGIPLQVDANSAYTLADADRLAELDAFDLLLIEQPLQEDDLVDHAALAKRLSTPVCLDESIVSDKAAADALALGSAAIINIKAGRVGGLPRGRRDPRPRRRAGVPVWCGGMLETGIGRAANAALAALPGFTLPGDISASARFYTRDIVTEPAVIEDGHVRVPTGPGSASRSTTPRSRPSPSVASGSRGESRRLSINWMPRPRARSPQLSRPLEPPWPNSPASTRSSPSPATAFRLPPVRSTAARAPRGLRPARHGAQERMRRSSASRRHGGAGLQRLRPRHGDWEAVVAGTVVRARGGVGTATPQRIPKRVGGLGTECTSTRVPDCHKRFRADNLIEDFEARKGRKAENGLADVPCPTAAPRASTPSPSRSRAWSRPTSASSTTSRACTSCAPRPRRASS